MGLRVVTADNRPENPGHSRAHVSHLIDTTDIPAMTRMASDEGVDGIIAAATDVAVETAAEVAEALDLWGIPPPAARLLTRKLEFRALQSRLQLPSPLVGTEDLAKTPSSAEADPLLIVKPNRASGSKGIRIAHDRDEALRLIPACAGESLDGQAFVERFFEGSQHTLEGVLTDGTVGLHMLTDRDTAPRPFVATRGHRVPTRLQHSLIDDTLAQVELLFGALGITDTVFDCDFVATPTGPVILEISPRLGGNSLTRLFRRSMDYDLVTHAINLVMGSDAVAPDWQAPKPHAMILLGTESGGRLDYTEAEIEALRGEAWVERLVLDRSKGDTIQAFIDGRRRVGEAMISAPDRDTLDQRVAELFDRLALGVST